MQQCTDYEEVKNLIDVFDEVVKKPHLQGDYLVAKVDSTGLQVRLEKTVGGDGARLSIGVQAVTQSQHFFEKAWVYAGLVPTGMWAYGDGSEYRHDICFDIRDSNMSTDYPTLELIQTFYNKLRNINLSEKREFRGNKEHPD